MPAVNNLENRQPILQYLEMHTWLPTYNTFDSAVTNTIRLEVLQLASKSYMYQVLSTTYPKLLLETHTTVYSYISPQT